MKHFSDRLVNPLPLYIVELSLVSDNASEHRKQRVSCGTIQVSELLLFIWNSSNSVIPHSDNVAGS